jgi:hypothetical protein
VYYFNSREPEEPEGQRACIPSIAKAYCFLTVDLCNPPVILLVAFASSKTIEKVRANDLKYPVMLYDARDEKEENEAFPPT